MIAVSDMRKYAGIMAAAIVLFAAFAVVLSAEESEASGIITIDSSKTDASGFKQDNAGTLTVYVQCTIDSATASIKVKEDSKVLYTDDNVKLSKGMNAVEASFKLSAGTHNLSITVTSGTDSSSTDYTVVSASNVWSNTYTYVAIIIVAIIAVIIAVVYMRANPRNKPTTTFTELEKEKAQAKSEAPAQTTKTEKKQYKASSEEDSGKIKYTSSRRK